MQSMRNFRNTSGDHDIVPIVDSQETYTYTPVLVSNSSC